jgi:hypothetical protein
MGWIAGPAGQLVNLEGQGEPIELHHQLLGRLGRRDQRGHPQQQTGQERAEAWGKACSDLENS